MKNLTCIQCLLLIAATVPLAALPGCGGSTEAGATNAAQRSSVAPMAVEVTQARRAPVSSSVAIVGELVARRRSVIVAEVDGVVQQIATAGGQRLDIGSKVSQGDVLVRLDPLQYELKLRGAEARLEIVKRDLENLLAWRRDEEVRRAQADRDEAKARLELTETDLKRAHTLLSRAAISQAQYDRQATDVRVARAALDRAEADLALATGGPTNEEIAVAKAAMAQAEAEVARSRWESSRTTIAAPYDGVVTDRYVDEGDRVTAMPRVEIMEMMDLGVLTARLGVPERYIGRIHVGDAALVFVKGRAEPVDGTVTLINDKVDASSRTFRIRVEIDNAARQFKVGQFVHVELPLESSADALTVPAAAVTYLGGEPQVFVCAEGRARRRAIQLGIGNEQIVEVLAGLADGETVVVVDPSVLADDMAVRVASPATETPRQAHTP